MWTSCAWIDPFISTAITRVQRLTGSRDIHRRGQTGASRGRARDSSTRDPEYRRPLSADRSSVHLTFYHPILPRCATPDIYLRTHTAAAVPRPPFRRPEDAADTSRGRGRVTCGCSETSRSDYGRRGICLDASWSSPRRPASGGWRPTKRSSGAPSTASSGATAGSRREAGAPFRAYDVRAGSSQIRCLFRDHSLSDLIGFVCRLELGSGSADFINRMVETAVDFLPCPGGKSGRFRSFSTARTRGSISKEEAGLPAALYGKFRAHPELRAVKIERGGGSARAPATASFPARGSTATSYLDPANVTIFAPGVSSAKRASVRWLSTAGSPESANKPVRSC